MGKNYLKNINFSTECLFLFFISSLIYPKLAAKEMESSCKDYGALKVQVDREQCLFYAFLTHMTAHDLNFSLKDTFGIHI